MTLFGNGIFKIIWILAPILSLCLDLLIGDPGWLTHPVVVIGRYISFLERGLRRIFPKNKKGERTAGFILAALVCLTTALFYGGIYFLLFRWGSPTACILLLILEVFLGCQAIAVRDMLKESRNVYEKLLQDKKEAQKAEDTGDHLIEARKAVGRIVGRDTERLDEEGIIKACVESVAESFSDGMFAPMLCFSLGGAPFAFFYKSVNTMDSMVGYKNEKYRYFGTAAARADDLLNLIPSRLSALLIILAASILSKPSLKLPGEVKSLKAQGGKRCLDEGAGRRAFLIWKRDRRNHASPNSAQTESAMAGALGVSLAGGAYYFGEYYDKPTIGDPLRKIEKDDILRAGSLYLTASILGGIAGVIIRAVMMMFLFG